MDADDEGVLLRHCDAEPEVGLREGEQTLRVLGGGLGHRDAAVRAGLTLRLA
jgi:hypothetical protein